MSETHLLERSLWVPYPRDAVFPFFEDPRNLEELTPPWVRFEIRTPPPIVMVEGLLLDYRIRIRGLPTHWRSEITVYEPPFRFVDEQRRGPYRSWRHEHRFEEEDGGTRIVDEVRYQVPGGPLAPLVHRLLVRGELERLFRYRESRMSARFPALDNGGCGGRNTAMDGAAMSSGTRSWKGA